MIKKLFKHSTENSLIQFIRYAFVGGAAFVVDFLTLYILKEYLHIEQYFPEKQALYIANGIALVFGLLTNYFLSIRWVFNKRTIGNSWTEFAVFTVIGIVGFLFNEFIFGFMTITWKVDYKLSKLVATGIVYFWNFFARKFILFK